MKVILFFENIMQIFRISKEQLDRFLFERDNIREGDSIEALNKMGKIAELEGLLQTSYQNGISNIEKDLNDRLSAYGDNQPFVKPPKTYKELFFQNLEDEMIRVLCYAAVVLLILGLIREGLEFGWQESVSILIAVFITIAISTGSYYWKERMIQSLKDLSKSKDVLVYRGGNLITLPTHDLLVGDIVRIQIGKILPADGILIQGEDIEADESSFTGEKNNIKKSVPVTYEKKERANPFLISGSNIISGSGLMVVAAVGRNSYYGRLSMMLQTCQDETRLQIKLSDLADKFGVYGMYAALIALFSLLIHYIWSCFGDGGFFGSFFSVQTIHEIVKYFIVAVSIIVVSVPEGLPISVSTAIAFSIKGLLKHLIMVRSLKASVTMGFIDNFIVDKTGTLTKNSLTVTSIFVEEQIKETIDKGIMSESTGRLFGLGVCSNSQADPKFSGEGSELKMEAIGNRSECALLEAAYKLGFDYRKIRNNDRIKKAFPFSSQKKKNATVYEDDNGKFYLFVKGSPESLLPDCSHFTSKDGVSKITEVYLDDLNKSLKSFAAKGERTFLLSYKEVKSIPENWDEIEKDLVIVAMVGLKDPLRDGTHETISLIKQNGITVRMITGDSETIAISIAKEAGILAEDWESSEGDYSVMEGKNFREFVGGLNREYGEELVGNLENFKLIRDQLRVLTKSTPEDKYLLTAGLKQLDHIVAVTGDGSGDAAALKKADVGIAMGITGTEVAKEASGIILLDDHISSIVSGIKWGRNIFCSSRKYVQFLATVNFAFLGIVLVGCIFLGKSPFSPVQMLWICLMVTPFGCLALVTEPASDKLLKEKSETARGAVITKQMKKFIISQGLYQIVLLIVLLIGPEIFGFPPSIEVVNQTEVTARNYAIFFHVFVFLQVFNLINARKLLNNEYNIFENFFNNSWFFTIFLLIIFIQFSLVQFGGKLLNTVGLSLNEHLICLLLGSTSLLSCLFFKVVLPKNVVICFQGVEFGSFKYYWRRIKEKNK